jgi:hypothetical protein
MMAADDRDYVLHFRPRALCVHLPESFGEVAAVGPRFKVYDRVGPDDVVTWVALSRTFATPADAWQNAAARMRSRRPASAVV